MFTILLLIIVFVLFISVALNGVSLKLGIPKVLAFLLLGVLVGYLKVIPYSSFEDFGFVQNVCTAALIFIMFYGGFGTRWVAVKHIVVEAGLLASVGVAITAILTSLFCFYGLGWNLPESLVLGAVVSSTDAASVFSILRAKKLGLKNNTAPMLEVESGSNDPMACMLTIAMMSFMKGTASGGGIALMLLMQIGLGAICGLSIAYLAIQGLQKINMHGSGYSSLFLFAVAIASYAVPDVMGGNGYLSVYLVGIILGNEEFKEKRAIVNFFDGINEMMQVITFFLIGILVVPANLYRDFIWAAMIFIFMLIVARPAAVFSILAPFRKYKFKQMSFISFVGLRGASAIVFAIMCVSGESALQHDLFNIVFCLVFISIGLQGSLIPWVAKKMNMIDNNSNVLKTFNDYMEDNSLLFSQVEITNDSYLARRLIKDIHLPKNILIALILRGKEQIIAKGDTMMLPGDKAIFVSHAYNGYEAIFLEKTIKPTSKRIGKKISETTGTGIIIMIRRGNKNIIPNGNTVLHEGDRLVLLR